MTVGFIGLGMMGRNAALNIARKGFEMVVYDVRPEAFARLIEKGAKSCTSPADVLDQVDIVEWGHDLVYRIGNQDDPKVRAFRSWVADEVREFMSSNSFAGA